MTGFAGCAGGPSTQRPPAARYATAPTTATWTKPISFSVLEDYDKGESLHEVARDFELMRALGIRTWRGSLGWDDYEPERGRYDFAWLHQFAALAERHGIELRPYLGYTAPWAAVGRTEDGETWNDPPARLEQWYEFVYHLAAALRRHANVRSYEIYNEANVSLWWDGTAAEYGRVLAQGAAAVRAAHPVAEVLLGGMVWPDVEWIEATCGADGNGGRIDVVPFHAYPETWTPDSVAVENYLGRYFRGAFLPAADAACGRKPIWINETGYATVPGRTERDQANWWARAIATFVAEPRIEHLGVYEIKDLDPESAAIEDAPNYHLGLTRRDRTKKLAFHTVRLLVDLLDVGRIALADGELQVVLRDGAPGELYHHLFVRPDGDQVLLLWDKRGRPTLDLRLRRPGAAATEYALDGTPAAYAEFDGHTLGGVGLEPGEVRIFRITRTPAAETP